MKIVLCLLIFAFPCAALTQLDLSRYAGFPVTHCDSVSSLLAKDPTALTVDANGKTAIHDFVAAAIPCRDEAIRTLAKLGVPVNAIDSSGQTALDLAVERENASTIVLLMHLGGQLHKPHPPSPLYKAVEAFNTEEVYRLCERGDRISAGEKLFGWHTFTVGPRINYMQWEYGFLGFSLPVGWQDEADYLPIKHFGLSVGMDFRLTKTRLLAPKIALEYRYQVFLLRGGYQYYTDFDRYEHTPFIEAGFSALGFVDLTYVHTFQLNGNPFGLGSNYVNLTITYPIPVWTR